MEQSRRHLQFLLTGPDVEWIEQLRHRWDPVMAARCPAHVSLVYPEEVLDWILVLDRSALATQDASPFSVCLGPLQEKDGGVWFKADDVSGTWRNLRARILGPLQRRLPVEPHITVVHPRTSTKGVEAAEKLQGVSVDTRLTIDELLFTETDPSGMRILRRFPLTGDQTVVVAAAVLRQGSRILLCHRHPKRAHYPNVWDLPGGHVEDRESPSETLARELHEELGIRVDTPQDEPWKVLREDNVELHVFLIDHWEGKPWNRASDEHDEIQWVDPEHAAALQLAHPKYESLLPEAAKQTGT